jgi:hypothetical protein
LKGEALHEQANSYRVIGHRVDRSYGRNEFVERLMFPFLFGRELVFSRLAGSR